MHLHTRHLYIYNSTSGGEADVRVDARVGRFVTHKDKNSRIGVSPERLRAFASGDPL